jgi:hypothetical protein
MMRLLIAFFACIALCSSFARADQWGLKPPNGIDSLHTGQITAAYPKLPIVTCGPVTVFLPVWNLHSGGGEVLKLGGNGAAFYYHFLRGDGSVSQMHYWASFLPISPMLLKDELQLKPTQGKFLQVDDAFQVVGEPYFAPNSHAAPFPPGPGQFVTLAHLSTVKNC